MFARVVRPSAMAIEELEEEVGILEKQITELKYCDLIKVKALGKKWVIATSIARVTSPEIRLNEENTDFKWINVSEVDNWIKITEVASIAKRTLEKFNLDR